MPWLFYLNTNENLQVVQKRYTLLRKVRLTSHLSRHHLNHRFIELSGGEILTEYYSATHNCNVNHSQISYASIYPRLYFCVCKL